MSLAPIISAAIVVPKKSGDHPLSGEKSPQCHYAYRICEDPEGGVQPGLCPDGDECEALKKAR